MKQLLILISILVIGALCKAQINPDSLINYPITKEVVEKLSNEELINLIKNIEATKENYGLLGEDRKVYFAQRFVTPQFIIGIGFIILLFFIRLISIPFYFNHRKTKSFHGMINGFIEKEIEIPQELLVINSQSKSDLRRSIILIFTGIAVILTLVVLIDHSRIWTIGIIPIIIGIGYLIASRTVK
jgi:hypothetical protein